jgi:RimJ/RimL family protein N-acetyltransferase
MSKNDLSGNLVRLVLLDPEKHASFFATWSADSEFDRLLGDEPSVLFHAGQVKEFFEKKEDLYVFMIQTLADEQVIGLIELQDIHWPAGDSFLGIGLGERDYWGKGYGSDALNIFLGYAFRQVGLRRVSLTVFEYNPRAIRTYEKAGFQHEGRLRQALNRDGRRWDLLFMGILREEWEERQKDQEAHTEATG